MRKILKLSGIVFVGLLLLTGCRSASVYNVENSAIQSNISSSKVYEAIKIAGASKGWIITSIKPGLAMGKLNARSHSAVVEIPYTENNFSIRYKDSINLNYDASTGVIHSNYNGWIQNLENAINVQLAALGN